MHARIAFTTYEHVEQNAPVVLKADGRREAFDRDKVMLGLQKACAKRPVSAARLTRIVDDLEARLRASGPQISSRAIGELVAEQLRDVDDVAYVRFASVYGRFTDTGAFPDRDRPAGGPHRGTGLRVTGN